MFTDIVNSTAQAAEMGDQAWRGIRENHDRRVSSMVRRYGGRLIKPLGDGFLITLDSPTRAVIAALAIIDRVSSLGIEVRVGIHTGEVEWEDGDITGIGVNIAARVSAKAHASEVLV